MIKLPNLQRKGKSLYFVSKKGGKQTWQKIGTTDNELAAIDVYNRIVAARQSHDLDTVAGVAASFRAKLNDPQNPFDLRPKTIHEYTRQLAPSGKLLEVFGHLKLDDIKPAHIGYFLDNHPAPVSANRQISLFSRLFKYAIRRGWEGFNPCLGIERNKERSRTRYIQDWEFLSVRNIAQAPVALAMDITYLTGLRLSDTLNLRLNAVSDGYLLTNERKTGTKARIELTEAISATLEKHRALPGRAKGITFVRNRKGQPYSVDGFESMWQRTIIKAAKEGIIEQRFTFHDIRAKHATDKDEQGLNAQIALGHADVETTKKYIRHPLGRKVKPLDSLPDSDAKSPVVSISSTRR